MDTWKIRLAFAAFMAFLISGCYAMDELRYAIWGREATASVTDSYLTSNPGRRDGEKVRVVDFSFRDPDGQMQSGTDMVHPDSEIAANDEVQVQYIPGAERHRRIAGNRNLGPVIFFLGCLGAMVVFVGLLVREANEPVRGRRR